jgi:hypothetical protein
MYIDLRSKIFETGPARVGIESSSEMPNVWGVLTEFWISENMVTLMSLADGTTSLYFSNGGGMIGGGDHPNISFASRELVRVAEDYVDSMTLTEEFPLPNEDRLIFYVLTYSGVFKADLNHDRILNGHSKYRGLFNQANEVITQMRLNTGSR